MDTVQRDSCVLPSDYEQLIETGISPGRGKERQKLVSRKEISLFWHCQTNLSFVRQGSGIQAVTGRWWAGLRPDQDCLVLYPRLLFKLKLHVGTSKMDLTSLFVPLSNVAILNKVLLPPLLWFLWLLVSLIDPLRISSSLGLPTPGSDFNNINDIGWSFRLCSGSGNSLVHQSYLFGFTLLE